ncbi:MAG: hypothetical protein IJK46_07745 [Prevotella sp.]|nr:hypothetical protein [Prevotella sp.]
MVFPKVFMDQSMVPAVLKIPGDYIAWSDFSELFCPIVIHLFIESSTFRAKEVPFVVIVLDIRFMFKKRMLNFQGIHRRLEEA